jgi:SAM-dependent methyltransferase
MCETTNQTRPRGQGVRTLRLADQLPNCRVDLNNTCYDFVACVREKQVLDIGCGYGRYRSVVEKAGGQWTGVEPYDGGAHTIKGSAEALPIPDESFDVVVMDAVLEHVLDPSAAFREVARVLRPDGLFIGYVAFMECFHEISYCHLSFKALEYFASANGMTLEAIGGGRRFGIDHHIAILLRPLPSAWLQAAIAGLVRWLVYAKSGLTIPLLMNRRGLSLAAARQLATDYYTLELLRQSRGFSFLIRKPSAVVSQ